MANPTSVNELSACYVTATYFDQNGAPYIPSTVLWKLDDITNNVNIVAWTSIGTPTASDVIAISSPQNALGNVANKVEKRQVELMITAPGGAIRYDYITYDLINIYGVP